MESSAIGRGAGLGLVLGIVVFAITQSPIWIGLGLVFGAAVGTVFRARRP